MYILSFVFIFLLGIIIGSFLNVVIYRFNTGKKITSGRSMCMTCGRTLRWYELIPIFSFLIQSGKCRRCASPIAYQYPLVEFITGLVFVFVAFHFYPILSLSGLLYLILVIFYVFIFSTLIVISVYDLKHKIIPDILVYVFCFFSFVLLFFNQTGFGPLFIVPSLMHIIVGPIFALPFALIWLVSRGRWMGLGDAKLILGMGFLLGPLLTPSALILSFWLGTIISLFLMFLSRKKINMKTEIPFAPFLIVSTFIVFIFNLDIYTFSSLFNFFQ